MDLLGKYGYEGLFNLVFTIVDNETNDNYNWFISTLHDSTFGEDDYEKIITSISDQFKGLLNSIVKVFHPAPHGIFLQHLQECFFKSNGFLGKSLKIV